MKDAIAKNPDLADEGFIPNSKKSGKKQERSATPGGRKKQKVSGSPLKQVLAIEDQHHLQLISQVPLCNMLTNLMPCQSRTKESIW